ncbi:Na+/H+ antiporter subunit E [Orrella sp. JC864]|uniref:Na+/H+ antiporter subunit E n=1 Tax=Orrella sp. JC864 TaxID=3120298 RepID=UPI0012BC65E9
MKSFKSRWFPSLPLSAFLLVLWLLMNDSTSPGYVALGLALAWFGPVAADRLRPLKARARLTPAILRLLGNVLVDNVRSNIAVACVILGRDERRQHSGFIQVPLDLRDPHGLAVLAAVVTSIPGTVFAGLKADGSELTLHVLSLKDEAEWIRIVKTRYERPLREIYE